jgi:hypothetical protein
MKIKNFISYFEVTIIEMSTDCLNDLVYVVLAML